MKWIFLRSEFSEIIILKIIQASDLTILNFFESTRKIIITLQRNWLFPFWRSFADQNGFLNKYMCPTKSKTVGIKGGYKEGRGAMG